MRPTIALLALFAVALAGCRPEPSSKPGAGQSPERTAELPDLVEKGVAALREGLDDGRFTSRQLVQGYLARIAMLDDAGPRLNAVLEINPQALEEADRLDAERARGTLRGPLHGIPVLLKDNIDATPMVNSAGSLALAEHRPKADAPLVASLRAAGAVILGKTNLSEWANFRSTRSISGWSGRGGQTRNPYVLDRSACGSSSGTGAAVAASLAAAGVGTETDGSVICPSAINGLVGIKPTVGLVSRSGIIPISHTQDTAGPMARSVADAAILLGAMVTGTDPEDAATAASAGHAADYAAHLKDGGLQGARIGVLRKSMGFHPDVDAAMERAIAAMRAAGAEVVDAEIATAGKWDEPEMKVLLYEFKADLEAYLVRSGAPVQTLAALIAFDEAHAEAEMPWFGQELFQQANAKGPLTEPEYLAAVAESKRLAGPDGIDAALQGLRLDALIAPSTSPAWTIDAVNGDHFLGAGYGAAAVAGYPSISVPMGDSHGLPLGLCFMGPAWSEARLIELAYAYEQATHARIAPAFRPTLIE